MIAESGALIPSRCHPFGILHVFDLCTGGGAALTMVALRLPPANRLKASGLKNMSGRSVFRPIDCRYERSRFFCLYVHRNLAIDCWYDLQQIIHSGDDSMNRLSRLVCGFNLGTCILMQAFTSAADGQAVSDAGTLSHESARRVWIAMEAVLDNHASPPTRQQMLQGGLRVLLNLTKNEEELNRQLARKISELTDRRATEEFLAEQLSSASQARDIPLLQLESQFIAAALAAHANYTPASQAAVEQQLLENRYVGIGIAIRKDGDDSHPVMHQVIRRGPAHRAGIKDGDLMLSVDGADTASMPLEAVVSKLRGKAGISVSLAVRQPSSQEVRTLTIVRGEVPIETVVGLERNADDDWDYSVKGVKDVAYIKLAAIRGSTISELRETAHQLRAQGFQAAVLDLRTVQSGEVRHAAMIADQLLEEGTIGATVVRGRREEFKSNADNLFPGWPIAVLIDQGTRGQVEWIAASLQQRRNTFLMGSPTRGFGFVTERV